MCVRESEREEGRVKCALAWMGMSRCMTMVRMCWKSRNYSESHVAVEIVTGPGCEESGQGRWGGLGGVWERWREGEEQGWWALLGSP